MNHLRPPVDAPALVFAYGSLKAGFANAHVNTGERIGGRWRTCQPVALWLLGEGEVPCIVAGAPAHARVAGELYRVSAAGLAALDRLERVGEPGGYARVTIDVEPEDVPAGRGRVTALVYVRRECDLPRGLPRKGPFDEYRPEHAARFDW